MGNIRGLNKHIILVTAGVCICSAAILACLLHKPRRVSGMHPIDITLSAITSSDGKRHLFILHAFNQGAFQSAIDEKISNKETNISSVRVSVSKKKLEKGTLFYNSGRPISRRYIKLTDYPPAGYLTFNDKHTYEIIFTALPEAGLSAGDRIYAELRLERYTARSNCTIIEPPPKDKKDALVRDARFHLITGDYKNALKPAGVMISTYPDMPDGFWYRGLALEAEKDYKGALEAYSSALERIHRPQGERYYEPPTLLIRKIRLLRKKVS